MKNKKACEGNFFSSSCFNEVYEEYYEKLYRYVFNIVKDEDDAFDVIQDIFITFEKKMKYYDDSYPLGSFLYKIAYNAAITKYRKNKIMSKIFFFNNHEDQDYNLNYAIENEDIGEKRDIEKMLSSLNNREKTIIYLKYYESMSSKEIAEILNIKNSYVDVLHSRILQQLQQNNLQLS